MSCPNFVRGSLATNVRFVCVSRLFLHALTSSQGRLTRDFDFRLAQHALQTEADFWTEEIWEIVEGIVKKDIKSHINSMGNRHIEEYPGKLHELLKPQDREPWILWLNKYREARVLVHLLDGGKFVKPFVRSSSLLEPN